MNLVGDGVTMDCRLGVDWIIIVGVVGGTIHTESSCSKLVVVDDWLLSGVIGTATSTDDFAVATLDFLDVDVGVARDRDDWRLGLAFALALGTSSGCNGSEGTDVDVDAKAWTACCRVRRL